MGAKQAPEAGEVVQELEPVDVIFLCQLLEGCRAAQEDGKDLQASTKQPQHFLGFAAKLKRSQELELVDEGLLGKLLEGCHAAKGDSKDLHSSIDGMSFSLTLSIKLDKYQREYQRILWHIPGELKSLMQILCVQGRDQTILQISTENSPRPVLLLGSGSHAGSGNASKHPTKHVLSSISG